MNLNIDQPIGYLRRRGSTSTLVVSSLSSPGPNRHPPITFSTMDSPVGPVMIGSTPRGLCWIGIHDSIEYLEAELRKDHPRTEISHDDRDLAELTSVIVAEIAGESRDFDLPLDIYPTPFQVGVWRELCAIPRGATRSYGAIARRLGRPEASRAVGHANGSNPLAILIPCHRAIGSNGALTGYRWGLEYKRRLLELEGAPIQRTFDSALALSNRIVVASKSGAGTV